MYFWRIGRLKDELGRGPLGQREAFAYVVATMLLYIVTGAPGLWNAGPEPTTGWHWAAYVATVLLVGGGSYAAYRANGGRTGVDFAARYFALGWVLGIRLSVLMFLPVMLLFLAWVLAPTFIWPEWQVSDVASIRAAVVSVVAFEAAFYWRLVHHLGQVAASGSSGADTQLCAG
jgi:hypothetical protein